MKVTPEQVQLGEAISQIAMSWLAFLGTTATTVFFLGFLVWCVLKHEESSAEIVVGVINSFLLILLIIMFRHIFYDRASKKMEK